MVVERQRDPPKDKEQDETEPQTVVSKNWNGQENTTNIKRSRDRHRVAHSPCPGRSDKHAVQLETPYGYDGHGDDPVQILMSHSLDFGNAGHHSNDVLPTNEKAE